MCKCGIVTVWLSDLVYVNNASVTDVEEAESASAALDSFPLYTVVECDAFSSFL